jgi:hypothetical protein
MSIESCPTAEMTWAETASDNAEFNGQRDNKVAVSASRPEIVSKVVEIEKR